MEDDKDVVGRVLCVAILVIIAQLVNGNFYRVIEGYLNAKTDKSKYLPGIFIRISRQDLSHGHSSELGTRCYRAFCLKPSA